MGRTNPTFRDMLRGIETQWEDYRRALRQDEQEQYDALFEHAANHADAAGYLNPAEPFHPILLSMLLEHEKELARLSQEHENNHDASTDGAAPGSTTASSTSDTSSQTTDLDR